MNFLLQQALTGHSNLPPKESERLNHNPRQHLPPEEFHNHRHGLKHHPVPLIKLNLQNSLRTVLSFLILHKSTHHHLFLLLLKLKYLRRPQKVLFQKCHLLLCLLTPKLANPLPFFHYMISRQYIFIPAPFKKENLTA